MNSIHTNRNNSILESLPKLFWHDFFPPPKLFLHKDSFINF